MIALTRVMGLGLAACNDGDAQVDKMPESSISSSTSSSMMSEENKMDGKMSGGGMTHAELAETTGVPLGTAKRRAGVTQSWRRRWPHWRSLWNRARS